MTLRHLLSHTAGFTHDPPYGNNNDLGPYSFEQHIERISDTWLGYPVGTAYYYENIGPDLAAYIVQVRAGKPFYQYVQERMLAPHGMTRSSYDQAQVRRDSDRAIGHVWPFAPAAALCGGDRGGAHSHCPAVWVECSPVRILMNGFSN